MNRRRFNLALALALAPGLIAGPAAANETDDFEATCRQLEHRLGGRLGASWLDTGSGRSGSYRASERFPMCSTFKWIAVAAVLANVDAGRERLDRRIVFGHQDLLQWSPATGRHANGAGMTVAQLCEAAITVSDNTAANLLLDALGGTKGWNAFRAAIGDRSSRLDRREPMLNEARAGDPRDTTTPDAMVADLQRVLLGDVLSNASRAKLLGWMEDTKYSDHRLRAGLPSGWKLADKTGTGNSGTGTAGDVGMYLPPSGAPIVLAVYLTRASATPADQEQAIARIGQWVRARG